jgi:predicted acylesterase/phospholipase RssA
VSEPTRDEMARNDVKKKLKVALVMGGGVSLGAFNRGAIAEITKNAVG